MSENMIDRKFDSLVDRLVIRVPEIFRYIGIRIAGNPFGWHLFLLLSSIKNAIAGMLVHFRSETDMDVFMDDTSEQLGNAFDSFKRGLLMQFEWLVAIDTAGARLRYYTQFFFTALVTFGCVFTGSREMAAVAACVILNWISTCYELSYKPVILKVRQVYVAARLISAFSTLVPSYVYYTCYRTRGVSNNMLLQGMMVFILLSHLILFTIMIAPNRRQQIFLRILSAVLGILPALLVASAVAFSATQMGSGTGGVLNGIIRIMGATMLFLYDRMEALYSLGSVRLPFSIFTLWFFNTFGLLFLMLAAWA